MQKLILLVTTAIAWDLDLRASEYPETNLFLAPGDEVNIILGGTAGTGGQWMYGFTN